MQVTTRLPVLMCLVLAMILSAGIATAQTELDDIASDIRNEAVRVGVLDNGTVGVQADLFAHPIDYTVSGLKRLGSDPGAWLSDNWGKTLTGATAAYFLTPGGQETGQDIIDLIRGKKDKQETSSQNDKDIDDDTSNDVVVKGDNNRVDLTDHEVDNIYIEGEGNSVQADRSSEK